jgi:hypothetical protein
MGAQVFFSKASGKTAAEAFASARAEAQYMSGHGGYTGTIAEKDRFVTIEVPAGVDAEKLAGDMIDDDDPRVSDKWGPAGCVRLPNGGWLFFGWASS